MKTLDQSENNLPPARTIVYGGRTVSDKKASPVVKGHGLTRKEFLTACSTLAGRGVVLVCLAPFLHGCGGGGADKCKETCTIDTVPDLSPANVPPTPNVLPTPSCGVCTQGCTACTSLCTGGCTACTACTSLCTGGCTMCTKACIFTCTASCTGGCTLCTMCVGCTIGTM